jgi:formate hydrogenlyase subunit 6/NADH:ubiquinone oxidoreductase subunit I
VHIAGVIKRKGGLDMMFEIPKDKALAAITTEESNRCTGCFFCNEICTAIACRYSQRKDGKNVIYKLVDYPPKEKNNDVE